jgi:excisionase family DNA binding protein
MASEHTTPSSTAGPAITKLLVTKQEAAEMLSVSTRTIDRLLQGKELPYRRIGHSVRIPFDSLKAFTRRDSATQPTARIRTPAKIDDTEDNGLKKAA